MTLLPCIRHGLSNFGGKKTSGHIPDLKAALRLLDELERQQSVSDLLMQLIKNEVWIQDSLYKPDHFVSAFPVTRCGTECLEVWLVVLYKNPQLSSRKISY